MGTIGKAWFEMAMKYGKLMNSFVEIEPGTPEWKAWNEYFYSLNWWPFTFSKAGLRKANSWTAPCRNPSQLPHFNHQPAPANPNKPYATPLRAQRETIAQLRDRLGPTFGLQGSNEYEKPEDRLARLYPAPKPVAAADVPISDQLRKSIQGPVT